MVRVCVRLPEPIYLCVFRGYLGPGGNHENGQFKNCVGGATGYVDRLVLGKNHLYQKPTADEVYGSGAFDPEGLVGE